MNIIAIDGASRRNGKPDCLAAGSIFVQTEESYYSKSSSERCSTSQRGEMQALLLALSTALDNFDDEFYLVTDSEYIFNTITKEWYRNWARKGWVTSTDAPVKNQDMWKRVIEFMDKLDAAGIDVIPYHVKGHLISLGKVTATKLIQQDLQGGEIYKAIVDKYDPSEAKHPDKFDHARVVFQRNHGFEPPEDVFRRLIVANTTADYLAGYYADETDAEWIR